MLSHIELVTSFSEILWKFRKAPVLKHSCHFQESIPGWIAILKLFALHFCYIGTYKFKLILATETTWKAFSYVKKWSYPNFAQLCSWTGPIHLWCDKVFGYWIPYLSPQACPSYHPFHKTEWVGKVSQLQLEAQPAPCLPCRIVRALPGLYLPRTHSWGCSDHSDKTRFPLRPQLQVESAWTSPLGSAPAPQLELHTGTCALTAHTVYLRCPLFPPLPPAVQTSSPLAPSSWFMVLLDFLSSRGWISLYQEK